MQEEMNYLVDMICLGLLVYLNWRLDQIETQLDLGRKKK